VTLIVLLSIVVAVVKITIDYKGSKLTKATTQRNVCEKNLEVNSPPRAAMCGKQLRKFGETLHNPEWRTSIPPAAVRALCEAGSP
jgi:hypothetical protein